MVGLGPAPAVGRDRHDDPSPRRPARFPPFRPLLARLRCAESCKTRELQVGIAHDAYSASRRERCHAGRRLGLGRRDRRRRRQALSRRLRRRGRLLPRPRASGCARRHAQAARPARLRAHCLFHHRRRRTPRRSSGRGRSGRARSRLSPERRLGGDRGGAQDGAPVFRRDRRAAAPPCRSRGARATTAIRSAPSPSAETRGGARSSSRS